MKRIVMLAAENDALRNGKVGGVGDVVRDLPAALARTGRPVTVITPSYGFLHTVNPSRNIAGIEFPFGGAREFGELYEVQPKSDVPGVTNLVFEHEAVRGNPIYCNDPPGEAFAQDATKYALFCSAIGRWLAGLDEEYILHLHDWHTPFLILLRELHPEFSHLKGVHTAYTIHNLAIQGNRPMRGPRASVEQWFPELFHETSWIQTWKDHRWPDPNFNPMAAGIRFSGKVNTVSPTYAKEILLPSDPANGKFRGEGLEGFLSEAARKGRLSGILNGAEYPEGRIAPKMDFRELCDLIASEVNRWEEGKPDPVHDELITRIEQLKDSPPSILLTSVTRVVEQKVKILYEKTAAGTVAMDEIMAALETANGLYIILGSGSSDYEALLTRTFRSGKRCLFLRGYSDKIANALYANGSLFMMPSSFEPCGIGQMVAMRDGQPCLVNAVGGLRDTVVEGVNGFQFEGETLAAQAAACVATTKRALALHKNDPRKWESLAAASRSARFTWDKSAREYEDKMYL